jgi:dihydrolipoamide dehydrogenase
MTQKHFDVAVIGGGPGGYVAAIKAAQLGKNVVCIEKRGTLGGTCLNVGCIPSKALLESSELYEEAEKEFASHGIKVGKVALDLKTMMKRKTEVVDSLTKGIEGLFKKNKIEYIVGTASFAAAKELKISLKSGGEQSITADNIIIATGSDVLGLPGIAIDERQIVSSTGALSLTEVPKHMVVIGGGYIGLEMGSVWHRLGAEVTVVEYLDRITPGMDMEVSKQFQRILEKQGIKFRLSTKVMGVEKKGRNVNVMVEAAAGGKPESISADVVLMSVGRKPYTEGLELDKAGIKTDEKGRIPINNHFETSVKGVYAIGDVVAGPMLAHKAEEEGVAVAEIIAGQKGHVNYDAIPGIVYTSPEVASVGKTEEELKAAGVSYKVGKFPFLANSRARARGITDGFVKILADSVTDKVLGVHIIGLHAGTLIAEAVIAIEFGASSEDIARTCHGHPTLNEAVKEAALDVYFKPIHM